jgi:ABC-type transport system involved in multi-copper enzyme maturation permease subunit
MTESRFLISLTWELKNVFRFPFPEIMLAIFTYMLFVSRISVFSYTSDLESLSWQSFTFSLAFHSSHVGAEYSVSAYLPMAILASIFATISFAYEIENGLMKVHLSNPTSKRSVFLSKWLSCFVIIFTTLSCAMLFFAFLNAPENDLYLIINSELTFGMLLIAASESFFIVSLTVAFSIFSRKASVSLVGSFATVYMLQLLGDATNISFLPPISFGVQVDFLFRKVFYPIGGPQLSGLPNFLVMPIASLLLTVVCYVYFSRRLELT